MTSMMCETTCKIRISSGKKRYKKIRCGIVKGFEHEYHVNGQYFWKEGDIWAKSFEVSGLYLTNGGRIVKPGCSEYASDKVGDRLLLTVDELQNGVWLDEFEKRLMNAKVERYARMINRA